MSFLMSQTPPSASSAELAALQLGWRAAPARVLAHLRALDPTLKGMIWTSLAGLLFSLLNTTVRGLTQQMDPLQAQFMRYAAGLLLFVPLLIKSGVLAYAPKRVAGQFTRGAFHTLGLCLWFIALPKIPLADMTAIGFTGPIFIMLGAYIFFKEPMHWDRWVAALMGFAGVVIVVAPKLSGGGGLYHLVMLASSPVFAASFLLTKSLTRDESAGVIVFWQALTVSLFSLPLAVMVWQMPTLLQCAAFLVCGLLGNAGHYCLTRSFGVADISSTQSVKFLDLMWAAILGWMVFGDTPSSSTIMGGVVISCATIWIARREARGR